MGAVDVASGEMAEAMGVLASLLGNLVGALFLQRLGWLFLVRLLLCHAFSH
jgi:hypothetical protein